MKELQSVGTPVNRRDGEGHVTGQTEYVDDIEVNNLHHLKAVRSPIPHAEIAGMDVSGAVEVEGVKEVLTPEDVPNNLYTILEARGVEPPEEPLLAEGRVRYEGEPMAAIVADSREAAMEAVREVELDLEELPAVFDVEEALEDDAPVLKPWGSNHYEYNSGEARKVRFGDVDAAFEEADHVIEGEYSTKPIEQAPTETTSATAVPMENGRYKVYSNTQALHFCHGVTADTLDIPPSKLQFVGGTVGGAFGGKTDVIVEQLATLAAKETGVPVRYKFSREEEMKVSSPRGAWQLHYKDGVTDDGDIVARQVTSYADAGAYNRHSPYAVTKQAANVGGPYTIPNAKFDCYCVYTNKTPSSSMRGFGVTPCSFAIELQMDKIADEVGLDPWKFRFRNAYQNGDMKPHRKEVHDATLIESMQAAAEIAGIDLPEECKRMSSNGGGA